MKNINIFLLLSMIVFCSACDEILFYPIEGNIDGIVTDNNNTPVFDANVTLTYTSSGTETTKSTNTNNNGEYFFEEIPVGSIEVEVTKQGLSICRKNTKLEKDARNATVHCELEGSPIFMGLYLEKETLSKSAQDTTSVLIQAEDLFDENEFEAHEAALIFHNAEDVIVWIENIEMEARGIKEVLFIKDDLTAENLVVDTYHLDVSIEDPDGNTFSIDLDRTLQVVE